MKSPYKLMDKKQGERYQRKIDIDDFMTGKHFGDGKGSIKSMTQGSSHHFKNKRQTINSYESYNYSKENSLDKKKEKDKKIVATNKNMSYLQAAFDKRQNEEEVDIGSRKKISINRRKSNSPKVNDVEVVSSSYKMAKTTIRGRNNLDHSPVQIRGMALINTEAINEQLDIDDTPKQQNIKLLPKGRIDNNNIWAGTKDQMKEHQNVRHHYQYEQPAQT